MIAVVISSRRVASEYNGLMVSEEPAPSTVTKTDIMRYWRCPYAFWLMDTGQVEFDDIATRVLKKQLDAGVEFERSALSPMPAAPAKPLEELLIERHLLFDTLIFRNVELGLMGIPDGIATQDGELIPIELKNHARANRSDRLELAFYWLLLEAHRSKTPGRAYGYLLLKSHDELVHVDLAKRHFDTVCELIASVRRARVEGVAPRYCGCDVCTTRAETAPAARTGSISLIHGVGWKRAEALEHAKIRTLQDVLSTDPSMIRSALALQGQHAGISQIRGWQAHAAAFVRKESVRFGSEELLMDSFIGLDLEYDGATPWLFGVVIASADGIELKQWWIDEIDDLRRAFAELEIAISSVPLVPILTWNGTGADLPIMRAHAKGSSTAGRVLDAIIERHIDLYHFVARNLRYPIPSLALKAIASHCGFVRSTRIADGFEALSLYHDYRSTNQLRKKRSLRKQLLQYNGDDLRSLAFVAVKVAALSTKESGGFDSKPPKLIRQQATTRDAGRQPLEVLRR